MSMPSTPDLLNRTAQPGRDYFFFGLYLALLLLNLWAILRVPTFWPVFSVIQGIFYVGLTEAFHQSVHMNLFPHRRANILAGVLFGTVLMGNFVSYKAFHLAHHRHLNTREDPESFYYPRRQRSRLLELLMVPIIVTAYMSQVKKSGLTNKAEKTLSRVCEVCNGLFVIGILAWLYVQPMSFLKIYLLPFMSVCYVQYFIVQAEHFDFVPLDKRAPLSQAGRYAFNLRLPKIVAFMILHTNYHGIHHRYPMAKWHRVPAIAKTEPGQYTRGVATFLKEWRQKGPRSWAHPSTQEDMTSP